MLASGLKAQIKQAPHTDYIDTLLSHFQNPGKTYGSAPLWVWNADVTKGKIDSMLYEFKENAFGGVFVHPRPGLITPYLSDKWFDLYRYTVEKGKALDLDVWIYDENSYPSGFAGGHVPEEMPSSYNQGQMLHLEKAATLPVGDTTVFLALKKGSAGFELINRQTQPTAKGDYYIFRKDYYRKSPWYGGFSYVDLMAKGVTEKFIDITMSGYEQNIGKEFGKTVPGVFTDEPNIEVQGENNIRWTPDLFTTFQKTWGYDLRPHLPSLYEQVGDWRKVRHNYYQVLLQLFIDRWSKPWHAYTTAKGLEWTGHYWEHGWPNPNHGGDNMAMYAWHQRPAIDMLFNQFDEKSPNAQFGNIRSVKELASVANQLGKKRTLSETYGGGGWELRFEDMKRLGDWEFVLGVNTLNQHLSYMTMAGARKYDYPQSFSYHSPWWPYYKSLNQYFARLSMALSSGEQVNNILILEPTTSAWMYSTYQQSMPRRQEIGQTFQSFITQLEKAQIEYDLGSENIIKDHGKIEGDRFIIGERAYPTVVIPPGMENLNHSTATLLKEFIKKGGKLIVLEDVKYLDGVEQPEPLKVIRTYRIQTSDLPLGKWTTETIRIAQQDTLGDLYHHRRIFPDGELLFLVNSSLEHGAKGTVEAKGKYLYHLDLMTGKVAKYPSFAKGKGQTFTYDLSPAGSQLFFMSDRNDSDIPMQTVVAESIGKPIPLTTQVHFLSPNVLTVDFCDVHLGDTLIRDQQVFHASDTIYKHFGFVDGNPWNTSVQFKDHTIRRDTFGMKEGFQVDYRFTIKEGVDRQALTVAIERPWLWEISLNGKPIHPMAGKWYLDKDFIVFDARQAIVGENKLTLSAKRMRVHAEVEPVYILGNFDLQSADKGWTIIPATASKLGSWKTMGKPMYGQQVSYSKEITVTKGKKYQLKLGKWNGTAAVVKVNGQVVNDVSYPPYQCLLDSNLRNGQNTIEVIVVGSLKNTLGPHHNQPKPGMVSPWLWRGVKQYPAGRAYDLYDYGLLEDYRVEEL
ncbi:alpha-L-rhamnosidase [Olivibacter ginsenosidimutans]|uniref:Alpha-L-rhamnosidase n=1 Tax=Olivibacter ginsenosidimutans TaxID=1176537 RepID=A0ABP9BVV4_9SPHI